MNIYRSIPSPPPPKSTSFHTCKGGPQENGIAFSNKKTLLTGISCLFRLLKLSSFYPTAATYADLCSVHSTLHKDDRQLCYLPHSTSPSSTLAASPRGAKQCKYCHSRAGIFKKSMGARQRGGIGFSYRPARLHRLAEFIHWNQFLGPINI